ncbi:hypothetical protein AB205_0030400 [Aquarana catesbeiana]|uniref:Kinesin-like protein n=1 Tax=Aquarana catesbeiana TaxID=8400 RepID=A0A2G9QKX0_AQUCT|nr:hypothetical protein AB205_0030400 [Aquarana catesbeiana]
MNNSNVKVAVRVRPLNQKEEVLSSECVVRVSGNQITLLPPISYKEKARNDPHNFTFDNCFWTEDRHDTGQEDVFRHLGDGALENIWHGYNVCIFAYGQTGSGKTFSMMGTDDQPGIVPRICSALFGKESNDSETIRIEASYFEIYNEEVRDLLRSTKKQKKLRVREDRVLGPYVEGLSCHAVQNYGKIKLLLDQGNNQRAIAETKMNEQSSRSHAILTLNVTQTCNDHKSGASRELMSKVSLVDLAGSERSYKSGAQGRQLKESCNINKSLLTLGLVINSLAKISENKKRGQYVNYRDSVLTWLLKNSLGGNSKTIMLATVSPAADNYQETLSTLKYADSAKQIVNQAVVNEDRKSEVIEELQEEIKRLREQLTKTEQLKQAELQEQLEEKENLLRDLKTSWEEKLKRTEAATQEWRKNLENMGVIPNKQDVIFSNQCYLIQQGTTLIVHNITDHTKIGSGLSQDIQISGAEQEHCVIRRTEDEVFLIPINNSKTYINGCLFKTLTQLWHEDKIQIRNNVFILHLPNRPKPDHMKTKVSSEAEAQTYNELNTENDTLFIPFNRDGWNSSLDEKSKLDKKAKGFTQSIPATDEFFSFPKNKMSDMFTQLSSESNSCLNNMNVNTIRNTPAEYLEIGVGRQIQDSMVQCSPQYGEASSQTFEGLKSRDYFQDTPEMEYHATLPRMHGAGTEDRIGVGNPHVAGIRGRIRPGYSHRAGTGGKIGLVYSHGAGTGGRIGPGNSHGAGTGGRIGPGNSHGAGTGGRIGLGYSHGAGTGGRIGLGYSHGAGTGGRIGLEYSHAAGTRGRIGPDNSHGAGTRGRIGLSNSQGAGTGGRLGLSNSHGAGTCGRIGPGNSQGAGTRGRIGPGNSQGAGTVGRIGPGNSQQAGTRGRIGLGNSQGAGTG